MSTTLTRRAAWGRTAALGLGLAASALPRLPRATAACADTIKVGVLHSLTGVVKEEEWPLKDAELLAIEEINNRAASSARGSSPTIDDPESRWTALPREGQAAAAQGAGRRGLRLLDLRQPQDRAARVREEQRPPLLPPAVRGRRDVEEHDVHRVAAQPAGVGRRGLAERARPAARRGTSTSWASYYIFPAHDQRHCQPPPQAGLTAVATKYVPLGKNDFRLVVRDIAATCADVVLSTLIGDSHTAFFDELAAQGITPDKVPVLSLDLSDREVCHMDPKKVAGHLAAASYFQAVATKRNQEFVKALPGQVRQGPGH